MLRSFRARLLAAALVVALIAIAVTAWVTNRTTSDDLAQQFEEDVFIEQTIYEEVSVFAITEPDWTDVDELLDELADEYDLRIALADLDGGIIADTDPDSDLPSAPVAFIDPANPLIDFAPESTDVITEIDLFNKESKDLGEFLTERGFEVVWFTDDFGFTFPVWNEDDPAANQAVEEWFESAGFFAFDELDEAVILEGFFDPVGFAEPALLYVDTGAESALSAVFSGRLLLAVLIVAGAAALVTVVVSRRLMQPITELTSAAQGLQSGNLSHRVEVDEGGEIGTLASAFNDMAASLEESDEVRRTMTADIAHELRTPLANIRGYLEAAKDGVVPSDEALVGTVYEEAVLLQHLVEDLETLTQADAGRLSMNMVPTQVGEILAQVVDAHHARTDGVHLEAVDDTEGVVVSVDPMRIRQAIGNFVDNALRHTPSGGSVTVAARSQNGSVLITVVDTGEGIAAEHLPHVFDRFYRADPSRTRSTGGSGLGMAIARHIVDAHGGTVSAASSPGQGTIITVALPTAG
ncbi:MAG: HAMP domain-containing protein [Acidimicrobiia bacterium]|nr:HAMP domain-containing protein [Acidimicrobiia bacterium]